MTLGALEIRQSTPADDVRRDAFTTRHPKGTFFHQSGWGRVVAQVFGHPSVDLLAFREDELVGVLPLVMIRGLFGRKNLVSVPYGVYGGPLATDSEAEQALVAQAVRMADENRVGHLELRYLQDPGPELVGNELYWTFIRDLPEDPEEVLGRMPKKARAEARKARTRHGLELSEGVWYVDDLYRLFLRNKHALGSPALPPTMFQALLREFPGMVFVHLVRRDRDPLAAVMSFSWRDTLIAYYSGTVIGADRAYSASNFMYLALQEWAVRHGYRRFDFCRSRREAGAFKFKVHQGFEPQPLHYRYHLVQDRKVPSFNPSNPRTRVLQEAWKKLPLWLVRGVSNPLSRYLP